jgi:hypothetical protein
MSNQYCSNSSESDCSIIYSFYVLVKKYCSIDVPESMSQISSPQSIMINKSGDNLETGLNLNNCSAVGTSTANVKFAGVAHSQSIVLVSDLSKSMDTDVVSGGTAIPAVERLKSALITPETGFLDRVYNIVKNWPLEFSVRIGLVAYNKTIVGAQGLTNIVFPGNLDNLKNLISAYSTNYETNTLLALNRAEEILAASPSDAQKIAILMSDGIPGVEGFPVPSNPRCIYDPYIRPCDYMCTGTVWPDCSKPPTCTPILQYQVGCACIDNSCDCGGIFPNCTPEATCPPGQVQYGCTAADCRTIKPPPTTVYNNLNRAFKFFADLFKPESALAVTAQTQCLQRSCSNIYLPRLCTDDDYTLRCDWNYAFMHNCDLTSDVNTQAQAMKDAGISLYTIYYDTSNSSEAKQRMCAWSSNNGVGCDVEEYTFAGTDIIKMINKVLGRIVTKPKEVKIGSSNIIDLEPTLMTSENTAEFSGLSCGKIAPLVTYTNSGYLEFSNIKINYCPAKLHP